MAEQKRAPAPAPTEPTLDLSDLLTTYSNWYRVTGTPEEMILEFALTPNLGVVTPDPIRVKHRMVLSYYTAKRLLTHLQMAVQRHEATFGSVEIDVGKRVNKSRRSPPAGALPGGPIA